MSTCDSDAPLSDVAEVDGVTHVVYAHIDPNRFLEAESLKDQCGKGWRVITLAASRCPLDTDDQGRPVSLLGIGIKARPDVAQKAQNVLTVAAAPLSPYGWSGTTMKAVGRG